MLNFLYHIYSVKATTMFSSQTDGQITQQLVSYGRIKEADKLLRDIMLPYKQLDDGSPAAYNLIECSFVLKKFNELCGNYGLPKIPREQNLIRYLEIYHCMLPKIYILTRIRVPHRIVQTFNEEEKLLHADFKKLCTDKEEVYQFFKKYGKDKVMKFLEKVRLPCSYVYHAADINHMCIGHVHDEFDNFKRVFTQFIYETLNHMCVQYVNYLDTLSLYSNYIHYTRYLYHKKHDEFCQDLMNIMGMKLKVRKAVECKYDRNLDKEVAEKGIVAVILENKFHNDEIYHMQCNRGESLYYVVELWDLEKIAEKYTSKDKIVNTMLGDFIVHKWSHNINSGIVTLYH